MTNKHELIKRFYIAKRDDIRQKEIKQLIFEIEHVMQYFCVMESKYHLNNLASIELRDVYIRLRYYRDRHNYKSDSAFFRKLAGEFFIEVVTVKKIVVDEKVLESYYLREGS